MTTVAARLPGVAWFVAPVASAWQLAVCRAVCSTASSAPKLTSFGADAIQLDQDRVTARMQQRQSDLQARWLKFPVPKENLEFRQAAPGDKAQVLSIEPGIHFGLDYLEDYYDEIVTHPNRCGIVAVDRENKKVLSFGYAIVGDGGRNLSSAGGRTRPEVRAYGLAAVTTRAMYEILRPRLHPAAYCSGVYNLPGHTRRYFAGLRGLVEVVLHNQQLGFECDTGYWDLLAGRFAGNAPQGDEPRPVENPVEFLSSEAVCSGVENRLFKPGQYVLVAKESMAMSRGNLLIWERRLRQVMCSRSDSSGEVTGVSIGNWNSVPIGGFHLVLNIYCRTEACAVGHVTAQLRAAAQRLRLGARQRLFVSAFVPSHLLYNEVLSGVRLHPQLSDLPQSVSPKLACDVRIGAWSPGTYV